MSKKKSWKEGYSFRRLREIDAKLIELKEERKQIKKAIKMKED